MDDSHHDGLAVAGESVGYSFTITNIGHAVLYNTTLSDPSLVSDGSSVLDCDVAFIVDGSEIVLPSPLSLDSVVTCNGTHVLTATDVDNLERRSGGIVTAVDQYDKEVSAAATVVVMFEQVGSIDLLLKSTYANKGLAATTADEIDYVYTITNDGLLTLYNITVQAEGLMAMVCVDTDGRDAGGALNGRVDGLARYPSKGLAPAAYLKCRATGTVTRAEINSGEKVDSVKATAFHESSADVLEDEAIESMPFLSTVPLIQDPAISVKNEALYNPANATSGLAGVGEPIKFTMSSDNVGNVDVHDVELSDDGIISFECADGTPPETWVVNALFQCIATHIITQPDIDTGSVGSTMSVIGSSAYGSPVTDTDTAVQSLNRTGSVLVSTTTIAENDAGVAGDSAGDTIKYKISLVNTGTTTLSSVSVASTQLLEQLVSGISDEAEISCEPNLAGLELAPQGTVNCLAVYEVQQDDMNAAGVNLVAEVSTTSPLGSTPGEATLWHELTPASTVLVEMDESVSNGADGILGTGDIITYEVIITNTGTTCLYQIVLADTLSTSCQLPYKGTCPQDEAMACTGTYIVNQADMDRGHVENTFTVSASSPGEPDGPDVADSASKTVALPGTPSTTIAVNGDWVDGEEGHHVAGETLTRTYNVTNRGTTTLSNVCVIDEKFGEDCLACVVSDNGKLPPGDSFVCSFASLVTQAEIDAGAVEMVAMVTATDAQSEEVNAEGTMTLPLSRENGLLLVKRREYTGDPYAAYFGNTITYTLAVYNSGTTTLSKLQLTHTKVTFVCTPALDGLLLGPAAVVSCTGQTGYTITQDDVDAGFVFSESAVEAWSPSPDSTSVDEKETDTFPLPGRSVISVEKTMRSITNTDGIDPTYSDAGDTATFDISIINTGDTRLNQVLLTDEMFGDSITCDYDFSGTASGFLPSSHPDGHPIMCEAQTRLTHANVDTGSISGMAKVTSMSPSNTSISGNSLFTHDLDQWASVSFVESGTWEDADGSECANAGENVSYLAVVKNEGIITLGALNVEDVRADMKCEEPESGLLGQGEEYKCRGSSQVTQDEVNAGRVTKEASVSGSAVNGDPVGDTVETVVELPWAPEVDVESTATWQDGAAGGMDGYADSTETVAVGITVTNTGNIDLTDASLASADITLDCGDLEDLAVGEIFTCTGTRTIFWPDVVSGWSNNTVTVEARDPLSQSIPPASASTSTLLKKPPSISIGVISTFQDDLPADGKAETGETITYTYAISNDGHAVLYGVTIKDSSLVSEEVSTIECPSEVLVEHVGEALLLTSPLVAGASVECTGTYKLTAEDIHNLSRATFVTISAKDQYGYEVGASKGDTVTLKQVGSVRMETSHAYPKETDAAPAATTDSVTYEYSLSNNGLLSLYNISMRDSVLGEHGTIITCTDTNGNSVVGSKPGEVNGLARYPDAGLTPTSKIFCSGTDVVSQEEINSGVKESNQEVQAWHESSPGTMDAWVKAESFSVVSMVQEPGVLVTVNATHTPSDHVDNYAAVGELVEYVILATNIGNVDLTQVAVTGSLFEGGLEMYCGSGIPDRWEVNTEFTCTPTYIITQENIDAGRLTNVASVASTPPLGAPFSTTSSATMTFSTTDKVGINIREDLVDSDTIIGESAGDTVEYTITITNEGTTTLSAIAVSSSLLEDQHSSGYSAAALTCDPVLDSFQLAPGGTIECTAAAEVEQGHLDVGGIGNDVVVAAAGPQNEIEEPHSSWQELTRLANVTIVTEAQTYKGSNDILEAGDSIIYTIKVDNTGNTCLQELVVSDLLLGSEMSCDNSVTELCPQASAVTCMGEYIITQEDIDDGAIQNVGTVSCVDSEGSRIVKLDDSRVDLLGTAIVSLELKSTWADGDEGDGLANIGEKVSHACTIKNEGTTSLVSFCITSSSFNEGCQACSEADALYPGANFTCTIDTEVQQTDIDAGQMVTTVDISSVDSQEGDATVSNATLVSLTNTNVLAIEATGSYTGSNLAAGLGDTVSYEYSISNDGTTTMSRLTVEDTAVSVICDPELVDLDVAPGTAVHCQSSTGYSITQEDINAGYVHNTVILEGWSPTPGAVKVATKDAETVTVPRQMNISLDSTLMSMSKSEGLDSAYSDEGDSATFQVTITNTGNAVLSSVIPTNWIVGSEAFNCDQDVSAADSEFLPSSHPSGAPLVCEVTVPLTASYVDAGGFNSTSEVTAVDPDNRPVRDQQTTWATVTQLASISIETTGAWVDENGNGRPDAGEAVDLSVVVANKGTVTLVSLSIADSLDSAGCAASETFSLEQGQQHECVPIQQVTQQDLNAGVVTFTASVTGTAVNNQPMSRSFVWAENLTPDPAIEIG
ncbi:unnamed protein product, partial [Ectocarpus sp. 6 AP-2014]